MLFLIQEKGKLRGKGGKKSKPSRSCKLYLEVRGQKLRLRIPVRQRTPDTPTSRLFSESSDGKDEEPSPRKR
jgi:hypothetical protein